MRVATKLTAYGLGLVLIFGVAAGAGRVIGPDETRPPAAESHAEMAAGEMAAAGTTPGGLQIAEDGYRLDRVTGTLSVGTPRTFAFRVLGPDGNPVVDYTTTHDRDLHLIVVRRDLTGFQHVHPTLGPDGTWSLPLAVTEPGQYRMLADFHPAGRADGLTLGADVAAPGDYRPRELPAASRTAEVDGYTVTLDGDLVPGASSKLTLTVSRGGVPVTDLQPYLGAYGHLVVLRRGDLAYLHVHPEDSPAAGPRITFVAEVPSAGDYGLFLDFQHEGKVRTAAFTGGAR